MGVWLLTLGLHSATHSLTGNCICVYTIAHTWGRIPMNTPQWWEREQKGVGGSLQGLTPEACWRGRKIDRKGMSQNYYPPRNILERGRVSRTFYTNVP